MLFKYFSNDPADKESAWNKPFSEQMLSMMSESTHWGRDSSMKIVVFDHNFIEFPTQGTINKILALVHIVAWRRSDDKPLSDPMMVNFNDAYMHHHFIWYYSGYIEENCAWSLYEITIIGARVILLG